MKTFMTQRTSLKSHFPHQALLRGLLPKSPESLGAASAFPSLLLFLPPRRGHGAGWGGCPQPPSAAAGQDDS